MFSAETGNVGQFDLVYSLGLVEHFDNVHSVLERLLSFVRPGGILFTEIPNLWSVHGVISKIYQPAVLAKHNIMTLTQLKDSHSGLSVASIEGAYVGMFSLNLVAWGIEPRWPSIDRYFLPFIQKAIVRSDRILCKLGRYDRAMPMLAPFIYVSAQKADE
jgi:2-polyprenyl-6-hydroxyphenyl methylase/3-demethylubiquinone-9 3-methyltransferase